jgi:hypothetical protein
LHPEIFSHGVRHAVRSSLRTGIHDKEKGDELTRAVLPSSFLDQTLQCRRAVVTRMFWVPRSDLLLTRLAPDVVAICEWAFQVSCRVESLFVEETAAVAPVNGRQREALSGGLLIRAAAALLTGGTAGG